MPKRRLSPSACDRTRADCLEELVDIVVSYPRLWQWRDGPRRQSDDVGDRARQSVGLGMRQVSVHAQHAARQFPELLIATVAVEAEDLCLGADSETFIALVHEQGPIGETSAR